MPEMAGIDRPHPEQELKCTANRREQRRVEYLVEGIGIAIFVALAIGAAAILIRNRRG